MPDTLGFGHGPDSIQSPHGEDRVANPTEAIIPIALPTLALGQRSRRSRNNRPGRRICQRFESNGRSYDVDARTVVVSDLFRPVVPPAQGFLQVGLQLPGRLAPLAAGVGFLRSKELQPDVNLLAGADLHLRMQVVGVDDIKLDVAENPDPCVAADSKVRVAAAGEHPRLHITIIEARNHVHIERHLAFDAFDDSDELATRFLTTADSHREEIDDARNVAP